VRGELKFDYLAVEVISPSLMLLDAKEDNLATQSRPVGLG
jgi:hypothetical protein